MVVTKIGYNLIYNVRIFQTRHESKSIHYMNLTLLFRYLSYLGYIIHILTLQQLVFYYELQLLDSVYHKRLAV